MESARSFGVLVVFQLQSGARVALRSVVPLAGGLVAAGVLAGSPLIVLAPAAVLLFPPGPSAGSALTVVAAFGLGFRMLAPRLTRGLNGWMQHLPARGVVHRRAITMGLQVAALPIILFVAAAGAISLPDQPLLTGLRIVALPVVTWASALSVLSVRPTSRVLAAAAGALSFYGLPLTFLIGIGSLAIADLGAGPVRFPAHRSPRRRFEATDSRWRAPWVRMTLRAFGLRYFSGPGFSTLVLVPLVLFLRNNALSPYQEALAIRFSGLAAAIVAISVAADSLVIRRPPWPWSRSLPFSSGRRVVWDAAILGATALPALIVAGVFDLKLAPALIGVMPLCALRAVSAVQKAPGRTTNASGTILLEGGLIAAAIAVWPWAALVVAMLTPLAYRTAVRDDQSLDVSRWHELHHLAAGDSLSWSDR